MLRLFSVDTNKVVEKGDRFLDFRGEELYEVTGWKEPAHFGSTGRVYCIQIVNGAKVGLVREFYPSVLNLEWKEVK